MNRATLENMTHAEFCRYIEATYAIMVSNRPTMRNMILDLIDYYENKIKALADDIDSYHESW